MKRWSLAVAAPYVFSPSAVRLLAYLCQIITFVSVSIHKPHFSSRNYLKSFLPRKSVAHNRLCCVWVCVEVEWNKSGKRTRWRQFLMSIWLINCFSLDDKRTFDFINQNNRLISFPKIPIISHSKLWYSSSSSYRRHLHRFRVVLQFSMNELPKSETQQNFLKSNWYQEQKS